jgi:hypothetical protein
MSEGWTKLDAARALHPADHLAIRTTEPARSLVAELLVAGAERDLWNACARLGRMMADEGASPTLAAGTIDNAATALGVSDTARIAPARASLLEGYVASVREAERGVAASAWDYPNCVVNIEDDVVAIACGRPTDDRDALTAWAERVASKLSKAKVKRAILEGSEAARAELASALELVGIALVPGLGHGPAPKKSWLPWKR